MTTLHLLVNPQIIAYLLVTHIPNIKEKRTYRTIREPSEEMKGTVKVHGDKRGTNKQVKTHEKDNRNKVSQHQNTDSLTSNDNIERVLISLNAYNLHCLVSPFCHLHFRDQMAKSETPAKSLSLNAFTSKEGVTRTRKILATVIKNIEKYKSNNIKNIKSYKIFNPSTIRNPGQPRT